MAKQRRRKSSKGKQGSGEWTVDPRARAMRADAAHPDLDLPPGTPPDAWVIALEGLHSGGRDKPDVLFHAPIPAVLFLDFAAERALRASVLRRQALTGLRPREDGAREPQLERQPKALDCIAEEASSITFAYMAIEAFANRSLHLHRDFEFEGRTAAQLESQHPVRGKVEKVLPAIYGGERLPDPLMKDFDELRERRRALEHLRESDQYRADSVEETTMGRLLRGDLDGPRIAAEVITHYLRDLVPEATWAKIRRRSPNPLS